MRRPQQSLLFPSHRHKHHRARQLHPGLRQPRHRPRRLQRYRHPARIIIRPRRRQLSIHHVRCARIVMPRHQHPRRLLSARPMQNRIHVHQLRRPGNPAPRLIRRRLHEFVPLHLQAAAALLRNRLELARDPIRRRQNPLPLRQLRVHTRERAARPKAHQLRNISLHLFRRHPIQRLLHRRIHAQRRQPNGPARRSDLPAPAHASRRHARQQYPQLPQSASFLPPPCKMHRIRGPLHLKVDEPPLYR